MKNIHVFINPKYEKLDEDFCVTIVKRVLTYYDIKSFDVNLNRFKVVSGLTREHWMEKGWIFKEDPLGWFQWYCRFSNGRRIPHMDEIQIKRWKNFRRHVLAIEKNCEKGDLGCRKRQRQAILQWAYNPFI